MANFDITVKIIMLGDFSVNKGTLLRMLRKLPEEKEVACLAHGSGTVEMRFLRNGKNVRVKISDTAGQERFRSITSSFYRGAHGCLLLFDVTQLSTFEHLTEWRTELLEHTKTDDIVLTLAGCNGHVTGSERQVPKRRAQDFAEYFGAAYGELIGQQAASLVRILEDMVDRIIIMASRTPILSQSITPLERKLHQAAHTQETAKRTKCAC